MIREASAMDVRQNLGELLNGVKFRRDTVLITKAGKPIAAMVDIDFYEKIKALKGEFERMSSQISAAYQNVPEPEGLKVAQAASRWARKRTRAK